MKNDVEGKLLGKIEVCNSRARNFSAARQSDELSYTPTIFPRAGKIPFRSDKSKKETILLLICVFCQIVYKNIFLFSHFFFFFLRKQREEEKHRLKDLPIFIVEIVKHKTRAAQRNKIGGNCFLLFVYVGRRRAPFFHPSFFQPDDKTIAAVS